MDNSDTIIQLIFAYDLKYKILESHASSFFCGLYNCLFLRETYLH